MVASLERRLPANNAVNATSRIWGPVPTLNKPFFQQLAPTVLILERVERNNPAGMVDRPGVGAAPPGEFSRSGAPRRSIDGTPRLLGDLNKPATPLLGNRAGGAPAA